jgi:hypothetical protein
METESSLKYSQEHATGPYPKPDESTPHLFFSLRFILIISSYKRLGLPSCLFTSGFPTRNLHAHLFSPIRATYPAHFILLDLIILTIFNVV